MTNKIRRLHHWLASGLLLILLNSTSAHAELVKLAVATNFTDAMQQIAQAFEQATGHKTSIAYGSSGKLYAQIQHGAPFHLFLSADTDKPHQLAANKLAIPSSQFTYATGKLVLWAPGAALVNTDIQSLLTKGDFSHLAIANDKLAPYGKAAIETLAAMGVDQALKQKLVKGENIGQTYQYIRSGNAQLGFVAYSQLMKDKQTQQHDYWVVDAGLHAPIQQDAILLNKGEHNKAAAAFMAYLTSDKVKAIIQSFGYGTPK